MRAALLFVPLLALACSAPGSGSTIADDEAAVTATHAHWLTGATKRRAEQLTSIFENSATDLQYAYSEDLHDGRGFTSGRAGFTTRDGDALEVVELYTAHALDNPLATYVPRLRELLKADSGATDGLDGYATAWATAADDPAFRDAQDHVVDRTYFVPAMQRADKLHLALPLSRAAMYDAIIQHGDGDDPDGLDALLARTARTVGGTPASGVDERRWLDAFFTVRAQDLAHAFDATTREVWAESVVRVDVLRSVAARGDFQLAGPISVDWGTTADGKPVTYVIP